MRKYIAGPLEFAIKKYKRPDLALAIIDPETFPQFFLLRNQRGAWEIVATNECYETSLYTEFYEYNKPLADWWVNRLRLAESLPDLTGEDQKGVWQAMFNFAYDIFPKQEFKAARENAKKALKG